MTTAGPSSTLGVLPVLTLNLQALKRGTLSPPVGRHTSQEGTGCTLLTAQTQQETKGTAAISATEAERMTSLKASEKPIFIPV